MYALFNHDLEQVFVGACDAPDENLLFACNEVASDIENWDRNRHNIECIEAVEEFPTLKHARYFAQWLKREGAFEGAENYAMGLDHALC